VLPFPSPPARPKPPQGRPDGKLAKPGKKVVMRYIGRLKSNGKVFDQTKGTATFSFRLGVGEVIKGGWLGGGAGRQTCMRQRWPCRRGHGGVTTFGVCAVDGRASGPAFHHLQRWFSPPVGAGAVRSGCVRLIPHYCGLAPNPAGWDRGVEGMRVGDKRRLTIPPAMVRRRPLECLPTC
jgi:hypothetical protein